PQMAKREGHDEGCRQHTAARQQQEWIDFPHDQLGRNHIAAPKQWRQNQKQVGLIKNTGEYAAFLVFERLCHRRRGDVRTIGLSSYSAAILPDKDGRGRSPGHGWVRFW